MPTYSAIFTDTGRQRIAAAAALGNPLNLTAMAVGDGGGSATISSLSQIALVNERFRSGVNRVVQDPGNAARYYLELLIPAAVGGWTIREFGIFDDQNHLCVVGNFPPLYKTTVSDGATSDLVVRVQVEVQGAESLTLQVDPAVAVATQGWVLSAITPSFFAPGGTTGQVWTKISNLSGDIGWADPATANILVQTREESQVATAGQTIFTLAFTTTLGLAVYLKDAEGGERLIKAAGAGGWQQGVDNTHVVLGTPAIAGARYTFVQNEAAGNLPQPLEASLNLSDVANSATARTNLGVYSKAEADQKAPAGAVVFFAMAAPPGGWLAANGATVSRTAYAALFAAIGTQWGAGDGSTTFVLPDARGEFLRGWDNGRGIDTGRAFGSLQTDALKSHTHSYRKGLTNAGGQTSGGGDANMARAWSDSEQTGATGANETRPRNLAMLACIKF